MSRWLPRRELLAAAFSVVYVCETLRRKSFLTNLGHYVAHALPDGE